MTIHAFFALHLLDLQHKFMPVYDCVRHLFKTVYNLCKQGMRLCTIWMALLWFCIGDEGVPVWYLALSPSEINIGPCCLIKWIHDKPTSLEEDFVVLFWFLLSIPIYDISHTYIHCYYTLHPKLISTITKYLAFILHLFSGSTHDRGKGMEPEFDVQLPNLTIKLGSDAAFTCIVKHLGEYKVNKYYFYFVCLSLLFLKKYIKYLK